MKKRASLKDIASKGKGVDTFFEPSQSQETPQPQEDRKEKSNQTQPSRKRAKPQTVTFSLYEKHQDFLDGFVTAGKKEFRHSEIGTGAISKSAVFQVALEMLEEDKDLQQSVLTRLRKKVEIEGSPHDPRKGNR